MSTPLSRKAAGVLAAFLLAPVAAALSGCEPDQLGAAAIVGGRPIPIEELQETTQEYVRIVPNFDRGEAQRQILDSMIRSKVIETAARNAGVSTTEGEVAEQLDRILEQVGGRRKLVRALVEGESAQVIPPSRLDDAVRDNILVNKLVEKVAAGEDPNSPQVGQQMNKGFRDASRSLAIEVNPRYGTWDSRSGNLTAVVGGGLSKSLTEQTRRKRASPAE